METSPVTVNSDVPDKPQITIGFWLSLLGFVGIAVVFSIVIAKVYMGPRKGAIGDGKNPETYGFDLSICLVPKEEIVASGFSKEGLPLLENAAYVEGSEVLTINKNQRGKFLVTDDRMVGVTINNESHAYPIRILNWHEFINDTVGGVPIAVCYFPLCDSVVVFERNINGKVLEFGISGLVYNSAQLFYDKQEDLKNESLWCPLQGRAITGNAAKENQSLKRLPVNLTTWGKWLAQNPNTKVLRGDPKKTQYNRLYKRDPYGNYYTSDELKFAVNPLPAKDQFFYKTAVVVIIAGNERKVFAVEDIGTVVNPQNIWTREIGGVPFTFHYQAKPENVLITTEPSEQNFEIIHSFWFAWYAHNPDAVVDSVK